MARRILPINHGRAATERTLTALRERTVRLGAEGSSPIDPIRLWEYGNDRARGRNAHGFTFLADWLGAFPQLSAVDAGALAGQLHEIVLAWDEHFGQRRENAPEMAFHDETTAQRLLGVVGVLDRFTLNPLQRGHLKEFAHRTAAILVEPDFYGGTNNHGMFQNLALLAWSALVAPDDDELGVHAWNLAAERLHDYFSTCFTVEGVHVENTPTYHLMIARYLPILHELFRLSGCPTAGLYARLLVGATAYAIHCVTPEGYYPPVSDTHRRRLDSRINLDTFRDREFDYAATGGSRGTRPTATTKAFPSSGYAMTRSAWGDPGATFVHFSCSYNADYHKHSDEQSIYLRSGHRDLLCEAGPYGYNWSDPFTKYAFSSAAHNSLLVGGKGLPRTESFRHHNPENTPLNSLKVDLTEDDLLDATGTTHRFSGRVWHRRLRVAHGAVSTDSQMSVTDTVRSEVGSEDLQFLWHIGPGLRAEIRDAGAEIFDGEKKVMEIEFRSEAELVLALVEGVKEPAPQGWYFPEFGQKVPAPVIVVEAHAADLVLTTEVRLSSFVWGWNNEVSVKHRHNTLEVIGAEANELATWKSPGTGAQAIVVLSGYVEDADRDRLVAALAKSEHEVCYVSGVTGYIADEIVQSRNCGEATLEQIARLAVENIRARILDDKQVSVATIGSGFLPGAIAALATSAPLIALDPLIPFPENDLRNERLAARFAQLTAEAAEVSVDILSSCEAAAETARSILIIGENMRTHPDFGGLLRADLEDAFSSVLLNMMDYRNGTTLKIFTAYDRRKREFIVELPETSESDVAVRVFRGNEQVLATPYAAGMVHRVPYSGAIGPHRLRIHVRGPGLSRPIAFTSAALRVR